MVEDLRKWDKMISKHDELVLKLEKSKVCKVCLFKVVLNNLLCFY
jgi:hypothetical protein